MHKKILSILESPEHDYTATINGWIRTRRDSKGGFSFLEVNDGSCMRNLQVIADQKLENYETGVKKLFPGSSVSVTGQVKKSEGGKQSVELHAEKIEVLGHADPETYAIGKQRVSFETLREMPHLRSRTNTFGAVTRVRNRLAFAVHQFFQERGFYYINTPIITSNDCEGAGDLFRVSVSGGGSEQTDKNEFFGKPAYLTVSGQLEVEAFACSMGNVYNFGPTFRAENSHTSRHLSEFWMIEPEMVFADLQTDMALAEDFLRSLFSTAARDCREDLEFFNQRIEKGVLDLIEKLADTQFIRLSYTDAVELLQKSGKKFDFPVSWGSDLQSEHERFLTEEALAGPVIVYDYPAEIKPFYMKVNPDGKTVRAMDVLLPRVGEIIGGSQREDDAQILTARITAQGIDPESLRWYIDLRTYGTVPHAGFGLGFERLVQFITGMGNIRDVIPYPRSPGSLKP